MKLNTKRTILVGLAFLSISTFWQVYDSVIPLILRDTFHMNDALAGFIMALDNILALFMLPLFGSLSDRTRTPLGRRMPYILGGTAVAVVALFLIALSDHTGRLPWFIASLGLALVAMSTYRSPAVSLMPDVTPKPLRSKGNAIINLMGAVGGILSLGFIQLLIPAQVPAGQRVNYLPLFAAVAGVMVVCILILAWRVRENRLVETMHAESAAMGIEEELEDAPASADKLPPDKRKSLILILCSVFLWFFGYNAVTTAFSKYATQMWGMAGGNFAGVLMVAQIAAIIAFIPVGMVASKIGRKRTILGGIVLLALAFGSAYFFHTFSSVIFVFFALAGVGWASINVNSYPMVVEMSKGSNVGKYTGYYYTFSMAAQVITPVLSGALLNVDYRTLFPYATFFVAASFVTMLFVKHGDSRPEPPKDRLEAFDVDD